MFARQTPQCRGAECGWDEPTRPFCPGARSIPCPLPPPPLPPTRQRRAATVRAAQPTRNGGVYPTWPRARGPGAVGSAAISRPAPPPPAPRPGGSHGRLRMRKLIQLCLISTRVLKHGEEGGGCRRSRGPAAEGQPWSRAAPPCYHRAASPLPLPFRAGASGLWPLSCCAASQAGAAAPGSPLAAEKRGGEPPSGVCPACSCAPARPPAHPW